MFITYFYLFWYDKFTLVFEINYKLLYFNYNCMLLRFYCYKYKPTIQ